MDCFLRDQTQAIRIIVWIATEKVTVHSVTSNTLRDAHKMRICAFWRCNPRDFRTLYVRKHLEAGMV